MKTNRGILQDLKAASCHDMLTVLKNVDQGLLGSAMAGERFGEYFYANAQDDGISGYLRQVQGVTEPA